MSINNQNEETIIREKEKILTPTSQKTENETPQSIKTQLIKSSSQILKFPSTDDEYITSNSSFNSGRWSEEEHQKFIEGILEYGNEWKKVQKIIKTRSSTQARSHAQKFFLRIKKSIFEKKKNKNEEIKKGKEKNIDTEIILNYVIDIISNEKKKKIELTNLQKEKLISVINCKFSNENLGNNKNDIEIDLDSDKNNNEYDNLIFKNRKSLKNKIFNIKKDISHKQSIEMSLSDNSNIYNNYNNNKNIKLKNSYCEKRNCYEEMKEYFVRKKSLNNNLNINNNNNIHRERLNSSSVNDNSFEFQKMSGNLFGIDNNIYKNFFPSKKRKISEQISTNNVSSEQKINTFQIDFDEEYTKDNNNNNSDNYLFHYPYYNKEEENNMKDYNIINQNYELNYDDFKLKNEDILMNTEPF